MKIEANNPEEYVAQVPEDRKPYFEKLRQTVLDNLPEGFAEMMSYGMIAYSVPHSQYPDGYHCDSKVPLPFMNIANQKNFIALYHMGIYAAPDLLQWFQEEYPKHAKRKLDMGKSCIRFKKMEDIPFGLIGELVQKMTVDEWVNIYETVLKK